MRSRWTSWLLIALVFGMVVPSAQAQEITVGIVPKIIGQPFPNALQYGAEKAAEDLGITVIFTGPTVADTAQQIEIIEGLIARRVDAIAVAPNDPTAIGPILEQAKRRGIAVYTFDSDAPNTVRDLFVTQALDQAIGYTVLDKMAEDMGGKGQLAIISGGPTAANLNAWISYMQERLPKYPDIELVAIRYAGEDQQEATRIALDLMNSFPDLRGIIGPASPCPPGAAEAVVQAGKVGQIFVGGVSTPSQMRQYVRAGVSNHFVLWDLHKLGYLVAWAGYRLAEGTPFEATNDVPWVGEVQYLPDSRQLVLGDPLVFDADNIDDYTF